MAHSETNITVDHQAAAAIDKYKIVELDGSNPPKLQLPGTLGNRARGIMFESTTSADEPVTIVAEGLTRVTAGEAIAEEDFITGDTSGDAVTATTGDVPIGIAQEDAESGDDFEIIVVPGLQARP